MEDLHDHQHEHIHSHPHSHGDGSEHGHTHMHNAQTGETAEPVSAHDLEQTKALLAYMIHHNEHHAEELADMLDALPEKTQKKLIMAVGTFEAANTQLQEVLDDLA